MYVVIIATRAAGNDGVTLEILHWREILERMGHKVLLVAGRLDFPGVLIKELDFQNPKAVEIHDSVVYGHEAFKKVEARVFTMAGLIEGELRELFNRKKPDLLIVPNIFSLPMHLPLSVSLTRVVEDLNIKTIARNHDFWWERKRYLKSSLFPFFRKWFPPKLPQIRHVVINSIAQEELLKRTGINAQIIGDSFNFKSNLNKLDKYSSHFKKDFGIEKEDVVFLQATRIVPRKRIELTIELLNKLNDKRALLLLAGHSGDEGGDYLKMIERKLKDSKVRYKFIDEYVNSARRIVGNGNYEKPVRRRIYTLWDCYNNCDVATYPTMIEGFGNQLVEAVYFKKPLIVTPYPVYKKDIAKLGFKFIEISPQISERSVNKVKKILKNKKLLNEMVEKNYELGKKYFSYETVERKLTRIFTEMELS